MRLTLRKLHGVAILCGASLHMPVRFGWLSGLLLMFVFGLEASAQYAINWWSIDGGGGTSAGGVYQVTGTIGQPDTGVMTNGVYVLQGGFWGGAVAIQTPDAPYLNVARSNSVVIVSWSKADPAWTLEFTIKLVAVGTNTWTLISPPYPTNAMEYVVTEPAPAGTKFYRLRKP